MGKCNHHGSGDFSCCKKDVYVQDKVCNEFSLNSHDPVVIYTTNVNSNDIFASGTIEFSSGVGILLVRFELNEKPVNSTLTVTPGSSASFTITDFNTIILTALSASPVSPVTGELCITARYEVN
jgi:hypothetical protein